MRLGVLLLCWWWPLLAIGDSGAPLELWIGSDKGYRGVAEVAQRFTRETGTPVKVRHFDNLPQQFELSATEGQGPDILIWAHDRYGEWAMRDWIVPLQPSEQTLKSVAPFTWSAVTINEHLYGYPIAVESVSLIYNRNLIDQPPQDFEQLFELDYRLAASGVETIAWDYTNPYFSWGLFSANGGYSFIGKAGRYDTRYTGVAMHGAIAGGWLLKRLLDKGVLAEPLVGEQALQAFIDGRVAMTIGGPWVWQALRDAGVDFAVAPLPSVQGASPKPFVGVWSAAITAFCSRPQLAADFLEQYLLTLEGLETINSDTPLGPVANNKLMQKLTVDPMIFAAFSSAVNGELMPHDPKMGLFWSSMKRALEQIRSGTLLPAEALAMARDRIQLGSAR